MKKAILLLFPAMLTAGYFYLKPVRISDPVVIKNDPEVITEEVKSPENIPSEYLLFNDYHIFQTFNNCGPAALSMALSYFDVNISQQTLGNKLRPYQNSKGDNDDKSVTLSELAYEAEKLGFMTYHRPSGNQEIIKQFVINDIPVITRTWLKPNDDIGHFRVIKGYNDNKQIFIQDDSLQGKNLEYSYQEFNEIWEKFNFEYLIILPKDKEFLAEDILKDNIDENTAWNNTILILEDKLKQDPDNSTTRFNYSIALYHTKNYEQAVSEYEKVKNKLPKRTLWYQIEPILSYYKIGDYQTVFNISDTIINNGNRAYSELYLLKSHIYLKQGDTERSKEAKLLAQKYNVNIDLDLYRDL